MAIVPPIPSTFESQLFYPIDNQEVLSLSPPISLPKIDSFEELTTNSPESSLILESWGCLWVIWSKFKDFFWFILNLCFEHPGKVDKSSVSNSDVILAAGLNTVDESPVSSSDGLPVITPKIKVTFRDLLDCFRTLGLNGNELRCTKEIFCEMPPENLDQLICSVIHHLCPEDLSVDHFEKAYREALCYFNSGKEYASLCIEAVSSLLKYRLKFVYPHAENPHIAHEITANFLYRSFEREWMLKNLDWGGEVLEPFTRLMLQHLENATSLLKALIKGLNGLSEVFECKVRQTCLSIETVLTHANHLDPNIMIGDVPIGLLIVKKNEDDDNSAFNKLALNQQPCPYVQKLKKDLLVKLVQNGRGNLVQADKNGHNALAQLLCYREMHTLTELEAQLPGSLDHAQLQEVRFAIQFTQDCAERLEGRRWEKEEYQPRVNALLKKAQKQFPKAFSVNPCFRIFCQKMAIPETAWVIDTNTNLGLRLAAWELLARKVSEKMKVALARAFEELLPMENHMVPNLIGLIMEYYYYSKEIVDEHGNVLKNPGLIPPTPV